MLHARSSLSLFLALLAISASALSEKRDGIKGRYIEVEPGVDLRAYKGALLILDPTDLVADKDAPVDNDAVRVMSDEKLLTAPPGVRPLLDDRICKPRRAAYRSSRLAPSPQGHVSARVSGNAVLGWHGGRQVQTAHQD